MQGRIDDPSIPGGTPDPVVPNPGLPKAGDPPARRSGALAGAGGARS